jgi:hypothetical protein
MRWAALAVGVLALAGCASRGPTTVARDRFDYVEAISDSWKRQTLLNLLKVRYADAPVFLDITQVISSYEFHGELDVGGQSAPIDRAGDTFAGAKVNGSYTDRPTITYSPLSSDKFARSLMAPIPISGIVLLVQAGYPADVVLRICANSVNGLSNSFGGRGERPGDPRYLELLELLRQAQGSGVLGMYSTREGDQQVVKMFLRTTRDPGSRVIYRRIVELLELDPDISEATVVYGAQRHSGSEVAIQSRSMMQVLVDFGSYIDVPQRDVDQGRVYSPRREPEIEKLFPPLIAVHWSDKLPDDAHVGVHYRDAWYWIDDRDHHSKAAFNFLMLLFSLTETGGTQSAPIVTVPAR